ncbi:hypothetical protein J6590_025392 [Homalodisca vitripennis]|nr:hypothetical protein J6590_025392 [Homalodisca vitripennis]
MVRKKYLHNKLVHTNQAEITQHKAPASGYRLQNCTLYGYLLMRVRDVVSRCDCLSICPHDTSKWHSTYVLEIDWNLSSSSGGGGISIYKNKDQKKKERKEKGPTPNAAWSPDASPEHNSRAFNVTCKCLSSFNLFPLSPAAPRQGFMILEAVSPGRAAGESGRDTITCYQGRPAMTRSATYSDRVTVRCDALRTWRARKHSITDRHVDKETSLVQFNDCILQCSVEKVI